MYKESVYPPPAEYLYINLNENILNLDSNGEHVVLARFPSEGKTLEVFGLNPEKLKSIAIPNDLREWPITALNNCTNLETISVYGEEVGAALYQLVRNHLLQCTKLKHLHIPSSVTTGYTTHSTATFPQSIQSVVFSNNTVAVGAAEFRYCSNLSILNFSKCNKLEEFGDTIFTNGDNLLNLNLSNCINLKKIEFHAFLTCPNLVVAIFPPSDFETNDRNLSNGICSPFNGTPIRTVIWKGRSTRPSKLAPYTFHNGKTVNQLVSEGTLTEIFVP